MDIKDYYDLIHDRPESKALQATKRLGGCRYIFNKNFQSLEKSIEYFTLGNNSEIIDIRNRENLNRYLIELSRQIHNTVAAAATVRDHAKRVYTNAYKDKPEFLQYQDKFEELFDTNPVIQFVQKLRNYVLHYDLPPVSANTLLSPEGKVFWRISLTIDRLLEWDRWNSASKKFLKDPAKYLGSENFDWYDPTDRLDLSLTFSKYKDCISLFYNWLTQQQVALHAREFRSLDNFRFELAKENPSLIHTLMRQNLFQAKERYCSFADVFETVTSFEQYLNLALNVQVPRLIATRGMEEARKLIEIPNELAGEIYASAQQLTDEMFDELRKRDIDRLKKDGEI